MRENSNLKAFGIGTLTRNSKGQILEVCYLYCSLQTSAQSDDALLNVFQEILKHSSGNHSYSINKTTLDKVAESHLSSWDEAIVKKLIASKVELIATFILQDLAPVTIEEAYLKLTLISQRLAMPNQLNLTGIFSILPNVAWTSDGPVVLDEITEYMADARLAGKHLEVFSVDKFPKMLNHIVPRGVRIGDGARVRLGAYLGEGTTVMHEGFVNYNAGAAGPNMIEGRISAGVFVGSGSDLGGGSSTMGTLSGGNKVVTSIGKDCLLGANAGTGIPLGDNCIIEAGLYLTAGTVVEILDEHGIVLGTSKARELAGKANLLFRRNSITGAVQALPNKKAVLLNKELHTGN
jgi:2,3,4,5-tetrahydropyridine-2,6-dicarboxylate N-succinyltransferase